LGSARVKGVHKTLVKLTPNVGETKEPFLSHSLNKLLGIYIKNDKFESSFAFCDLKGRNYFAL